MFKVTDKETLFLIHTESPLISCVSYSSNGLKFKLGLTFIIVIRY